ncbi:MAG: hypothetical protein LBQ09_00410 [Acidobacteriaceae bacterium]|nr:hypothetical protein [Acidobacteriaceae bacterium]
MKKCFSLVGALTLLVVATACSNKNPSSPSTAAQATSTSDTKTGVTIVTPLPVSPATNAQVKFGDQPLALTVKNGATSGKAALTYSFQVATDVDFASIVYSKDGVAEGTGQTSLKIDPLTGDKDYFWRVRAVSGSSAGLYSTTRQFHLGPQVVVQPPTLVAPGQGGSLNNFGSLVVANSQRTGPAGQIFYKFEVADSAAFNNIVFTSTVPEQGSQTAAAMTASLTVNATYFWRVTATDSSSGVTSAPSGVSSFQYVLFDMRQATIYDSPSDLGFWPETAKITLVNLQPGGIIVDFDKRTSANRWPDQPFGDNGNGTIQYTLGMCLFINSHWDCSAVVQFWYGRDLSAGGSPREVSFNWFYDRRWGPMLGYQPKRGETVGFFVGAGNLRDRTSPSTAVCPRTCERSNVVLIPWAEDGSANYSFSTGPKAIIPTTLR